MNTNIQKQTTNVYDCFTFFNELELLEIRLNELNSVVDKFVLVEALKTHQGKEKPLYYEENKQKFKEFHDKVIHIIVDFPPDDVLDNLDIIFSLGDFGLSVNQQRTEYLTQIALSSFSNFNIQKINAQDSFERLAWKREHYQRNMIMDGLNCEPDDVVIISDIDEIPRAGKILAYKDKPGIKIFKQKMYYFYLNYENRLNYRVGDSIIWHGSIMTKYKNITLPQAMRVLVKMPDNKPPQLDFVDFIENGGWHFSYLGGEERIRTKLQSFCHVEYNNNSFNNEEVLSKFIDEGVTFFDKTQLVCVPIDDSFPAYLRDNIDKFPHLICKNYY
jgi:beta-1,4-mannosyl-glycoprotein beta-1,4-N-acetylglucosaminyltransferase